MPGAIRFPRYRFSKLLSSSYANLSPNITSCRTLNLGMATTTNHVQLLAAEDHLDRIFKIN